MAKKLNPNTAQFYPIIAYPGTTAYDEARSRGELASEDYDQWLDKDGQHNTTVIRKGLTSQELVDFCDRARREFYLRPAYIAGQAKMALTNSRERYRVLRGAGTLFKHLFKKHGAPQQASGYSANAKPRPASSQRHSHPETLPALCPPQELKSPVILPLTRARVRGGTRDAAGQKSESR
jgi:hypothetical protein